uniref:EF-1_beta_acid domain-containing protein n=1 Tax=Glossina pallidipes TaxID=7398 RepID=A0A1B0A7F9_GLOPL
MVAIPTFMRKRTSFHSHNICAKKTLHCKVTLRYPHVQRLHRHIASFNDNERSVWGSEPLPSAKSTVCFSTPADNLDISGSDEEEDAEDARIREERVAAYAAKKMKNSALIARSSVMLDMESWDDETDKAEIE